ncbi:MAG: hypothetical protein QOH06_330 [Acidobacteriota bacterium]|jgi:hypothetical protein|nr:hypothetical protein [Acidobacteriota bacterium]
MRWYELLIEGSEDALPGDAIRGSELRLASESLTDRVLDFLNARSHHVVFASADQAREIARDLRVESLREVVEGRFGFKAEAYSPEIGAKIHDALNSNLPDGIMCVDLEKEKRHPEAKGVELFTPAHDYVYKARGTIVGTPPGILEMNRRLHRLDFVHEEPLELVYREASLPSLGA